MNKKLRLPGLMIIAGCLLSSKSFAQDYQQVNIFNRFADWSVTIGKSPEEKQHIIDQRIDMRAKAREARDHRRVQEDKIAAQKDGENRNYGIHTADLRNQYKDDPDTMNKRLQEADNDHHAKMNDFDDQWKANEGR